MSVHVLRGDDISCLFCSTTDWAFGPVFYPEKGKTADERAEAFLRYINCDPRLLREHALETQYLAWIAQEESQYEQEASEEETA